MLVHNKTPKAWSISMGVVNRLKTSFLVEKCGIDFSQKSYDEPLPIWYAFCPLERIKTDVEERIEMECFFAFENPSLLKTGLDWRYSELKRVPPSLKNPSLPPDTFTFNDTSLKRTFKFSKYSRIDLELVSSEGFDSSSVKVFHLLETNDSRQGMKSYGRKNMKPKDKTKKVKTSLVLEAAEENISVPETVNFDISEVETLPEESSNFLQSYLEYMEEQSSFFIYGYSKKHDLDVCKAERIVSEHQKKSIPPIKIDCSFIIQDGVVLMEKSKN